MDGVAAMIDSVLIEVTFPDGTKLIPVNQPVRAANGSGTSSNDAQGIPGELILNDEPIIINEGRATVSLQVRNTGDRPVQVGSHYHFAEVNSALEFDRDKAVGFRLDIPAGTSARFEPGDAKDVNLVAYGGRREVFGFRGDFNRAIDQG